MHKLVVVLLLFFLGVSVSYANKNSLSAYYGAGLCAKPEYRCVTIKRGQTWEKMFPNERERDLVQRLNRSDTYLWAGKKIAIPVNMKETTIFDISPYPRQIKKTGEKIIMVDQGRLAWGAYDEEGKLVKWGPISSGKDYCRDLGRSCRTMTGIFYMYHKKGKGCKSGIFPVGRGGSIMPYCMFFYKGYAMHGSKEVFGGRYSHGCVRLFIRDAKWLNHHFVDVATREGHLGTKVIVQKLVTSK